MTRAVRSGRYDTFMQHDVQELNRVLVDKLEEKMKDMTPEELDAYMESIPEWKRGALVV